MRKSTLTVALVCLLGAAVLNTSCIGSFQLTNKLLTWNRNIDSKFVNELVFICFWILPVYEVSALADVLVLNSIEFWSGNNPVAAGTRVIDGNDGRYLVQCDGTGYTITSQTDGRSVRLDFHADDRSWSYTTPDGHSATFLTFVDDTHVALPAASDGTTTTIVEVSQAGVMAYQAIASGTMLAAR